MSESFATSSAMRAGIKEGYGRGGSRARVHSFGGGGGGVFIRRQKYVAKTSTATTITIEPTITRIVLLSGPNRPPAGEMMNQPTITPSPAWLDREWNVPYRAGVS